MRRPSSTLSLDMNILSRSSAAVAAPVALALLAGCGGDGTGPAADACAGAPGSAAAGPELRLAPGEARPLAAGRSLCLVLPDTEHAYVLAYVDTRASDAARQGPEPALDSVTVRVRDLGGGARTALSAAAAHPGLAVEEPDFATVRAQSQPLTHPAWRQAPWSEGETFPLFDDRRNLERSARVQRVYGSWLVVAAFVDEETPALTTTLGMLDAGWPILRDLGLPLLRAAFGEALPITSAGSGQLLLMVRGDLGTAVGMAFGTVVGPDVLSWLAITPNAPNSTRTPTSLASLVQHELTHAFQRVHLNASRPAGEPVTPHLGAAVWGIEGGATFMQRELARRQAGVSPTANYDWLNPGATEAETWYANFAPPADGTFTNGYSAAAGFLAHLAGRRIAAGESVDAAVAAVSRGAVEGWYGHVRPGAAAWTGLTARMRARLGGGWEPTDALLGWTLSHAMDDRTPSAMYQDAAFLGASRIRPPGYGWAPHATLAAGSGAQAEVRRAHGSPGYFELSGRGAFHLTAPEGVRWMVARVR